MSEIHPWTARFVDAGTEAAYLATRQTQDRQRLRYLIWGLFGVSTLNIGEELWQNWVHGADIATVMSIRLLVLGVGIIIVFAFERFAQPAQTPAIATGFVLLATVAQALLLAKHPRHELVGPVTIIAGVLMIYLYLPVVLPRRTGLALLTGLTLWVSWSFWREPPPPGPAVFRTGLWLLLAHLIGFTSARVRQIEHRLLYVRTGQLEAALAREQEAHRQLRRFAELITHEFRNPLGIIKSQAQVAQREAALYPNSADARSVLRRQRIIERAVARLQTLFQQWLHNDRLATDELRPQRRRFPAGSWLTELTEPFALQAQRSVTLDLAEPVAAAHLEADETLISSALLNLLDNAHKYSPAGAPIGVTAVVEHGELGIQISDAGIGIATSDLERIFEKSVRLHPEGGTRGLGLGLYLVRRIAVIHGGRIQVASTPGQGSIFTLWLPLSP